MRYREACQTALTADGPAVCWGHGRRAGIGGGGGSAPGGVAVGGVGSAGVVVVGDSAGGGGGAPGGVAGGLGDGVVGECVAGDGGRGQGDACGEVEQSFLNGGSSLRLSERAGGKSIGASDPFSCSPFRCEFPYPCTQFLAVDAWGVVGGRGVRASGDAPRIRCRSLIAFSTDLSCVFAHCVNAQRGSLF